MLSVSVKDTMEYLRKRGYENLANLIMKTWKHHPEDDTNGHYDMWREQLAVNLPILFLASIYLHDFVKERRIKNLLFVTRDCIHWHKIYRTMYPNENVHYFDSSRNVLSYAKNNYNPDYEKYVEKITGGDIESSVYIDIHGTGKRMIKYFQRRHGKIPHSFILSSGHSSEEGLLEEMKELIKKRKAYFMVFGTAGTPIEMLNYDLVGTCNDYDENGPIRAPLEYKKKYIQPYHDCVRTFISILKRHPELWKTTNNLKHIRNTVEYLFKPAFYDHPLPSKWIDAERTHSPQ